MSKLKPILISAGIVIALVFAYQAFFGGKKNEEGLISGAPIGPARPEAKAEDIPQNKYTKVSGEFLSLLLNIRNIKLDDSILANPAFTSLSDSSITLTQDG